MGLRDNKIAEILGSGTSEKEAAQRRRPRYQQVFGQTLSNTCRWRDCMMLTEDSGDFAVLGRHLNSN